MTTTRLRTILPLALATFALGMSPVGCGDDGPAKGGAGGTSAGGASGSGGRGGSGGSGSGGAPGGTGGMVGSGGAPAGGAGGSDAGGDVAGSGGAGDAPVVDAAMGGAGGADAAVDELTVDMAPVPPDLAPDTIPMTVNVSTCSQINCPALLDVASQCAANESDCDYENKMTDPTKVTNYCHENGVKKFATTTGTGGTAYTTIMEVVKAGGAACYTLEIKGTGPEASDVQSWTYKSPGGATLATATWTAANERLTIHCGGVNYVIGDVGCPGTDGQPNDGDQCAAADCER